MSEYTIQAEEFLTKHGLKFRATHKGDKCPPWVNPDEPQRGSCSCGSIHGDRYRITISRPGGGRLSFDFWDSYDNMRKGEEPTAYDVLACISGDAYCPEVFEDFCDEYGYGADSRKAWALFNRMQKFAGRMKKFFTEEELTALSEIQ